MVKNTKKSPKSENRLELDAPEELIQITWCTCTSLNKASSKPNKYQRKTRIEQETREKEVDEQ
jgi:hypothetical protein